MLSHVWNILLFKNIFLQRNYVFSLILLNVYIYLIIITCLFLLFFLYDTKYIKTLNEFKNLNITSSTTNIVVLSLLSMAGMPPLLGFFGKFLIILFFLKKAQFFLFIVFIFINLFVIYFYILNIRFLISKSTKHFFFIKGFNVYFNFPIVALFLFLFLLNFFGIFFLNDLIIFCNSICYFYF